MKTQGSKDLKFIPHKANHDDRLDVPFRIVGHKLRWVAARASEDKLTRVWKVLRKSELPASVVEDLERRSVNVFRDGETIRFGGLVLAYASDEAVAEVRKRVQHESNSQIASIGMDNNKRPGIRHDHRETSVERMGSSEFDR